VRAQASKHGRFEVRSDHLQESLTERAVTLAGQIVNVMFEAPAHIDNLLDAVADLPTGCPMGLRMLHKVAETMSEPTRNHPDQPPRLGSVIRRVGQWEQVVRIVGKRTDWADRGCEPVGPVLLQLQQQLGQVAGSLVEGTIPIAKLHDVLRDATAFVRLCKRVHHLRFIPLEIPSHVPLLRMALCMPLCDATRRLGCVPSPCWAPRRPLSVPPFALSSHFGDR
jgi:hypothetical protein